MKTFAFVSDFDGTLTERDFYHIAIDKYIGEKGRQMYLDQKSQGKKIDVPFLNRIFMNLGIDEQALREEIHKLPLDAHAEEFIKKVKENGGDFYIVSAGTSYYIEILLEHKHINHVKIVSMQGKYKSGGFEIVPDKNDKYYSEIFGIDKSRLINDLKKEYKVVYFAGDSEPDKSAALAADLCFAKGELIGLLEAEKAEFTAVNNYSEIDSFLTEKGVL